MKKRNKIITIIAVGLTSLAVFGSTAQANCVNSVWKKTSGDSLAHTIKGRMCGTNQSVRLIGLVDTGWISMQGGNNQFTATFVDNFVTTDITMNTAFNTMTADFYHQANDGAVSSTSGSYVLQSLQ